LADLLLSVEDRQKKQREKEKEESKEIQLEAGWLKEEIALLTKGIVKFPPGTKDRWATIADFVETKTQKEVIKKA
jgi:phage pi2 protein 07